MMEQEMEKARTAELDQVQNIEASQDSAARTMEKAKEWEKDMQQQVGDDVAEQEGVLEAIDAGVGTTDANAAARTAEANALARDMLHTVADTFSTTLDRRLRRERRHGQHGR